MVAQTAATPRPTVTGLRHSASDVEQIPRQPLDHRGGRPDAREDRRDLQRAGGSCPGAGDRGRCRAGATISHNPEPNSEVTAPYGDDRQAVPPHRVGRQARLAVATMVMRSTFNVVTSTDWEGPTVTRTV